MDYFPNDEERSILNRRCQEINHQLQVLASQKTSLDQAIYAERYNALLSQILEVERCLADIYLDELSLQHMEGSE